MSYPGSKILPKSPLGADITEAALQSLPRNQVPEWAASYINYKGLKNLVKAASEKARHGETVDPAGGRP